MIEATVSNDDKAAVPSLNLSVRHRTPIFHICRKLKAMGYGEHEIEFRRNGTPVFKKATVNHWAQFTIYENHRPPTRAIFEERPVNKLFGDKK